MEGVAIVSKAALAALAGAIVLSGSPSAGVGVAERPADASAAARPFPQHVALPRGARVPRVGQHRLDAAALRLWRAWRDRYLRSEGGDGIWVEHDPTPTTVSEGIGYGMVLAAYFGDRAVFDGLWQYSRAHPSRYATHLMAWKQALRQGRMVDVAGRDAATDGDLDIAYGLLLAHRQWGSTGAVDYARSSRVVARAVLRHMVNHRLWSTTPGDWARRFGGSDLRYTRPSDFMPAHFLAFAEADPGRRRHWLRVYRATAGIVESQFRRGSRDTGLMPDFMVHRRGRWRPVPGRYLESRHDGDFYWNACRTPWRLSLASLAARRHRLRPVTTTFTSWLRRETGGRPGRMVAGYYVHNGPNGKSFRGYYDLAFGGPAAVAAMQGGQGWLDRSWRQLVRRPAVTDYYGDSLRLLAVLVLSRNWWQP